MLVSFLVGAAFGYVSSVLAGKLVAPQVEASPVA
jgi:hypothetical protein